MTDQLPPSPLDEPLHKDEAPTVPPTAPVLSSPDSHPSISRLAAQGTHDEEKTPARTSPGPGQHPNSLANLKQGRHLGPRKQADDAQKRRIKTERDVLRLWLEVLEEDGAKDDLKEVMRQALKDATGGGQTAKDARAFIGKFFAGGGSVGLDSVATPPMIRGKRGR